MRRCSPACSGEIGSTLLTSAFGCFHPQPAPCTAYGGWRASSTMTVRVPSRGEPTCHSSFLILTKENGTWLIAVMHNVLVQPLPPGACLVRAESDRCGSEPRVLAPLPRELRMAETKARETVVPEPRLAGWTGLEPATSDVTGEKSSTTAERVTETGQRVTTTGPDKERHE
jgi:hypothetical protein